MHRTVWTLVFALLLQVLAGSAWAMQGSRTAPQCHETLTLRQALDTGNHAQHAQGKTLPSLMQADGHHCCAVGLGTGVHLPVLPPPQTVPASPQPPWASLSLQPDLRPPI